MLDIIFLPFFKNGKVKTSSQSSQIKWVPLLFLPIRNSSILGA